MLSGLSLSTVILKYFGVVLIAKQTNKQTTLKYYEKLIVSQGRKLIELEPEGIISNISLFTNWRHSFYLS